MFTSVFTSSKALVVHRIQSEAAQATDLVAIGDDRTDEELFPRPASRRADHRGRFAAGRRYVPGRDYRAVRRVLRSLLTDAEPPIDDDSPMLGSTFA